MIIKYKVSTKSVVLFLLFFFLLCRVSFAQYNKGDSLVVDISTEIKVEPGPSGKGVKEVPQGSILVIEGYDKASKFSTTYYYKVSYDGEGGYVSDNFVQKVDDSNRSEVLSYNRKKENLREKGMELILFSSGVRVGSADGASFFADILNNSNDKTIKYVKFHVVPFNPVGDVVSGEVEGESEKVVRAVGPIEPGKPASFNFDNVWYNSTIDCVELRRVDVEYMNESSYKYIEDLEKIVKNEEEVEIEGECSK